MSVPPPPNQWGSQPPTGDRPADAPQWGPPAGGQPEGAPQWGPQEPWGPPPGPPPRGGGKGKWIFGAMALLAVIAVTVVVTVLVVGKDSGGGESPTPTNGNGSEFASANDKGPVGIITEDPTCDAWTRVNNAIVDIEKQVRWPDRDQSLPATAWTPDQRAVYDAFGKAIRNAANQTVNLVKLTPHRVMRELYEQFIAYSRAFADKIPQYSATDKELATAPDTIGSAIVSICGAVTTGSASALAPMVPAAAPPSGVAPPGDPADPQPFLSKRDPVCADWAAALPPFAAATSAWGDIDPALSATQWTPEQRAINDAVGPVMTARADELERFAQRSGSPALQDFAVLSAQYFRAYVLALPTYTGNDSYVVNTAIYLPLFVDAACQTATHG
jgi:hypothetical protein